jgi:hypothetical protein
MEPLKLFAKEKLHMVFKPCSLSGALPLTAIFITGDISRKFFVRVHGVLTILVHLVLLVS